MNKGPNHTRLTRHVQREANVAGSVLSRSVDEICCQTSREETSQGVYAYTNPSVLASVLMEDETVQRYTPVEVIECSCRTSIPVNTVHRFILERVLGTKSSD